MSAEHRVPDGNRGAVFAWALSQASSADAYTTHAPHRNISTSPIAGPSNYRPSLLTSPEYYLEPTRNRRSTVASQSRTNPSGNFHTFASNSYNPPLTSGSSQTSQSSFLFPTPVDEEAHMISDDVFAHPPRSHTPQYPLDRDRASFRPARDISSHRTAEATMDLPAGQSHVLRAQTVRNIAGVDGTETARGGHGARIGVSNPPTVNTSPRHSDQQISNVRRRPDRGAGRGQQGEGSRPSTPRPPTVRPDPSLETHREHVGGLGSGSMPAMPNFIPWWRVLQYLSFPYGLADLVDGLKMAQNDPVWIQVVRAGTILVGQAEDLQERLTGERPPKTQEIQPRSCRRDQWISAWVDLQPHRRRMGLWNSDITTPQQMRRPEDTLPAEWRPFWKHSRLHVYRVLTQLKGCLSDTVGSTVTSYRMSRALWDAWVEDVLWSFCQMIRLIEGQEDLIEPLICPPVPGAASGLDHDDRLGNPLHDQMQIVHSIPSEPSGPMASTIALQAHHNRKRQSEAYQDPPDPKRPRVARDNGESDESEPDVEE
ncbi:hypothetical protein NUW54_g10485 [Trametes sanguinea]|uniref:Uncharacterized protein n=1 Tax=Trametes sanguinea TaxID=158606 RepID=A0ACC1P1U3_9APHY|nr:hypothetical protein NUW54_g10485 [Trametes sanguinea]